VGKKSRRKQTARPKSGLPEPKATAPGFHATSGKTRLALIVITLAVFVCYSNTLDNDFVHDDRVEILENPLIKDSSNLQRIVTSPAWSFLSDTGDAVGSNYYRPVQYLTYFALHQLFGTAPFGYHLWKLLLHLGVCLLLFRLGLRFLGDLRVAVALSLIFAVHPVNTEAVSWISGITDVTYALLFLLSFYIFLSDEEHPSAAKLAALYGSFFMGMFSKETMATFIPVVFIYQWLQGKLPSRRQVVRTYVPLTAILLFYLAVRVSAIGSFTSADQIRYESLNWFQGILNQAVLLSRYFQTSLLPLNLNAHHVFNPVLSLSDFRFWYAVTVLAAILGGCVYAVRRSNARQKAHIVFGLLMFVIVLSPVLIFYQRIGENVFAERYLYLPAIGLVLSLTVPLARISLKPYLEIAFLALLVLFSWKTVRRNAVWQNELVFYQTTARDSPAASIWNNLGTVYGKAGQSDDALKAFETSVSLRPNPEALGNLGRIYASRKRFSDSETAYVKAIQLNPRNANNYSGLGDLYFARQRYGDAIPLYEKSLEIRPNDPRLAFNLVDACRMEKRYDEALAVCKKVAALGPLQAKKAYRTMAGIYAEQGLLEKAAEADRMSEAIPLSR
jgi:hypothetical protein